MSASSNGTGTASGNKVTIHEMAGKAASPAGDAWPRSIACDAQKTSNAGSRRAIARNGKTS